MTRAQILGIWALAPPRLTASPRRRRLLFVALAAPAGLTAVLGVQVCQEPRLLGLGGGLFLAALLARRHSEPRFRKWEASGVRPVPPSQEHSPCP